MRPARGPWPALATSLWWVAAAPEHRRFRRALADPAAAQEALLRRYLRANADTAYGRRHGFAALAAAADPLAELPRRLPLTSWEDYRPYVERVYGGEAGVLTAAPVERLAFTSGSTAAAKWIPYTAESRRELRRAVAAWIFDLYRRRPRLAAGPAYWCLTPAVEPPAPPALPAARAPAVPLGFEDDSAYLGGLTRRLVDAALAVPAEVARLTEPGAFFHATLLHLLRARGLRLISVWHPSFLTLLLDELERRWEALLADLAAAAPRRAAELERLGAGAAPRRLWPRLGLVSCWGDAHAALGRAELERRLEGVEIQAKGLLATEAVVTVPYAGRRPLALRSHVFEFLDAGGEALPAHRLERGATYSVVVTTGGGLYRYRLGDRVEVEGFLGATPCLRFLGKEDHVSDRRGEKLGEGFVAAVLAALWRRFDLAPRFALLAPEEGAEGAVPAYTLYLESGKEVPPALLDALAAALEEELAANPHYRQAAALGQLAPARARPITGGYATYADRLRRRGRRLGDIKPSPLSALAGWDRAFRLRPPARREGEAAGG